MTSTQRLLCFTVLLLSAAALHAATATEITAAGKRLVVMENAALRLTVDPSWGGRVSSFVWKASDTEWVLPGNAGFFMDHVWQQSWPGELLGREYEVRVVEAGPERAVVEASVVILGKGDQAIEGVRWVRTMTLTGDSPRLDVTLRVENPTPEPRAPGLWVQNVINVGGSRDNVWTWRPTTRGIIRASWSESEGRILPVGYQDDFAFDPVAGWTAQTHPPSGEGVVFLVDYNELRCLYNNGGSQSVEWWYEQTRLAPGRSAETTITVWPFEGLPGVTHADKELLAYLELEVSQDSVQVSSRLLRGPEPPGAPVSLRIELMDYDTGRVLASQDFGDIVLGPAVVSSEAQFPAALAQANLLARATVALPEGRTQSWEQFHAAGAVMGTERAYRIERPRRLRSVERPERIVRIPHEKVRILHLRGLYHDYYRLPAAARRIGAELEHGAYRIFVYGPALSYFPSDYPELMAYDVIVINNVPLEAMDEITLQYLTDYVEHGGALLVIGGHWAFGGGGYRGSLLEDLLPVITRGPFDVRPVAHGLLTPALAPGRNVGTLWGQVVNLRPEAQVLLRAGDQPFWVEWRRGQGRAAVMTGLCYGERTRDIVPFWEWGGWPDWLGKQLLRLAGRDDD